jgi:imidazolonepropionase-like amidohydrolase
MKYVTSFLKGFWNPKQDMRFRSQPKEYFEITRMEFEKKLLMIPVLHHAGVRMLAGTDTPNPYCFPGFSLHDELAWMVKAGLTPIEALQTATINPAIYFSIEKILDRRKNKMASLVILDKNPLIDIRNTTSINTVILRVR